MRKAPDTRTAAGSRAGKTVLSFCLVLGICAVVPSTAIAQGSSSSDSGQSAQALTVTNTVLTLVDVPVGNKVPVDRVLFDQGGYQIITQAGDTISIPFANHELSVMRFGRADGDCAYLVNEVPQPTLYVPANYSLSTTANPSSHWYPLPPDYTAESQPAYVNPVATYADLANMQWYSNMSWYGGVWGYAARPTTWIPGTYVTIGAAQYSYPSYTAYAATHPGTPLLATVPGRSAVRPRAPFVPVTPGVPVGSGGGRGSVLQPRVPAPAQGPVVTGIHPTVPSTPRQAPRPTRPAPPRRHKVTTPQ